MASYNQVADMVASTDGGVHSGKIGGFISSRLLDKCAQAKTQASVQVAVRCRPISALERKHKEPAVVSVKGGAIVLTNPLALDEVRAAPCSNARVACDTARQPFTTC